LLPQDVVRVVLPGPSSRPGPAPAGPSTAPADPSSGYTMAELDELLVGPDLPSAPPAPATRVDLALRALTTLPADVLAWLKFDGLTEQCVSDKSFSGLPATDALCRRLDACSFPTTAHRREAFRAHVAACTGRPSMCLLERCLGIANGWSKFHYAFVDDTSHLCIVHSAVHRLITALEGTAGSRFVYYDPQPKIREADDWTFGMVHKQPYADNWICACPRPRLGSNI